MARFVPADADRIVNLDNVAYLVLRSNGDVDVHLVGDDKTIVVKGDEAKKFLQRCKIEYDEEYY